MQNMQDMQDMQNMQNMQNMRNIRNMQNIYIEPHLPNQTNQILVTKRNLPNQTTGWSNQRVDL